MNWGERQKGCLVSMQQENLVHLMYMFRIEMINFQQGKKTCQGLLKVIFHCLFNWTIGIGRGKLSPVEVIPSGPKAGLGLVDEIISVYSWQRSQHSVIWGQDKSPRAGIISTIKPYLCSTWAWGWLLRACWGLSDTLSEETVSLTGTGTRHWCQQKTINGVGNSKHTAFNMAFLFYLFMCANTDNGGVSLSRQ